MADVEIDQPKDLEFDLSKKETYETTHCCKWNQKCIFKGGTGTIWICGGIRRLCRPLFKEVGWKNVCNIEPEKTLTIHTKARGDYKIIFIGDSVDKQEHMGRKNQNYKLCLGIPVVGTIKVSTG